MKFGRSSSTRALVAALALAFMLSSAPAWGAMTDPPSGTTLTNPSSGGDAWRQGWGNSLNPEFTITGIPADDDTATAGFLYTFSKDTVEDVPADADNVTFDPSGLMRSHTFDLYNWYRDNRAAGAVPKDLEGRWYVNMRFFSAGRVATATAHPGFPFGIDITPPAPVEGFQTARYGIPPVVLPTQAPRRTISWLDDEYDALSGTYRYHLYLNGAEFRSFTRAELPSWMDGHPYLTLEDLPPGVNTIGIRAEDRATNLSEMRTVTAIVDPDVPELSMTFPAQGQYVGGNIVVTAVSTDRAAAPTVTFKVDGTTKYYDTAPPYEYGLNTKSLSAGHHTVTVVSTDLFGHTRSITRDIYVDNVAPTITSVSDSPDPWYPCIQDGYKDVAYMKAYINERCSDVFAQLYAEDGTTLISDAHLQNVGPGWITVRCVGYDKNGVLINLGPMPKTANYKYRFTARDRAGNWKNGAFNTTTVKNFEIVTVSNGVKVVPR